MKKLYFLIPIVIFVLLVGVSEFRLSMGNTKHFDFGDKFWIHRGGVPENSIEGINAALSRGFHGIEIDVFFNESSRQFVVSHDKPTDQTFLTLERVLKEFKETPLKLWIDYKNSDLKHFIKAKNRLKELVLKYGFESRLFIESPHALHQWLLSWSGLNASMWVRGFEKSRIQFLRLLIDRWFVGLGHFISVSMPHEAHSKLKKEYGAYDILVFTVNDSEMKKKFSSVPNIKVVLMDINPIDSPTD